MSNNLISIFIFLITFLFSCKKEKESTSSNNPVAKIDVSNITLTDYAGNIMFYVDTTDWRFDNNWTSEEFALFTKPDSGQLADTKKSSITVHPAYPNPFKNILQLSIFHSKAVFFQLVITDSLLTIKDKFSFKNMNTSNSIFSIKLSDTGYVNSTNYRLYYSFSSETDRNYYKGHGDIKISN